MEAAGAQVAAERWNRDKWERERRGEDEGIGGEAEGDGAVSDGNAVKIGAEVDGEAELPAACRGIALR